MSLYRTSRHLSHDITALVGIKAALPVRHLIGVWGWLLILVMVIAAINWQPGFIILAALLLLVSVNLRAARIRRDNRRVGPYVSTRR